jgi:hypothetical protein
MPHFFEKPAVSSPHPAFEDHMDELDHLSPKISEAGVVETLLSWTAPSRAFRKKDRSYYTTILIIVVLLILIAFLAREFLLIGVLLAITFVTYVLAFVPPGDVLYKISTQGITIGDHFYFWHDLESFWLKNKDEVKVVYIQTHLRFPGQLILVLGEESEEEVKRAMARFLPFHEIPRMTLLDRWAEGLQKHFPLENTHR